MPRWMNRFLIEQTARNVLSRIEININRSAGNEFVPARPDSLHIETSSVCNLKCRFCAYVKKHSAKVSMKNAMFASCVEQALELGYRKFELTPCTGDVFMDRHIFSKLQLLEDNPGVEGYEFFTNFSIPNATQIERLVKLNKLRKLTISIYGHDLEHFIAIAQSTEKVYKRLITNLETLYGLLDQRKFELAFGYRSVKNAPRKPNTDIMRILERFKQRGFAVRGSHIYNNWGGHITPEDVKGLAIDITSADKIYKNGACAYLFNAVQIMATGIVNGCACRDVDATLRIGDVTTTPLREIISTNNPAYMALIEEQQRGAFRPVCRSCDFYKSIYHKRAKDRRKGAEMQTIAQFKDRMDTFAQSASGTCAPAGVGVLETSR